MDDLIGLTEISHALNVSRDYARDRVVKRPDFPRPALALSQKCRRWEKGAFETWMKRQKALQQR
jgi:predicted DNA-binding transcriptional regulator AlpA